jgi:hypothetical protein
VAPRHVGREDGAPGGAGLDEADGIGCRGLDGDDAAPGVHQEDGAGRALAASRSRRRLR